MNNVAWQPVHWRVRLFPFIIMLLVDPDPDPDQHLKDQNSHFIVRNTYCFYTIKVKNSKIRLSWELSALHVCSISSKRLQNSLCVIYLGRGVEVAPWYCSKSLTSKMSPRSGTKEVRAELRDSVCQYNQWHSCYPLFIQNNAVVRVSATQCPGKKRGHQNISPKYIWTYQVSNTIQSLNSGDLAPWHKHLPDECKVVNSIPRTRKVKRWNKSSSLSGLKSTV